MSAESTKRCPACWSTLEAAVTVCPECQEPLNARPRTKGASKTDGQCGEPRFAEPQQPRARGWSFGGLLVLAILAGVFLPWRSWLSGQEPQDTGTANQGTGGPQNPISSGDRQGESPFLPVFGADGKAAASLLALASAKDGRQHYCLPADLLPTRGSLHSAGQEPMGFEVVRFDRKNGVILLVGPAHDPRIEPLQPLDVSPGSGWTADSPLTAISPAGRRWPGIRVRPGTNPMVVDRSLPLGSVLLDPEGAALAMVGRRGLLPLTGFTTNLATWRGSELGLAQQELRNNDPRLILEDVASLLDSETTSLDKVIAAIDRLQRSQHLARDAKSIAAFDKMTRWAHHQRIRILSAQDGPKAMEQALLSFQQFGDHHGIHADAVLLQLGHGDPSEALRLFVALDMASTKDADAIRKEVAEGLRTHLHNRLVGRRGQEAAGLGAVAVRAFPRDGALRMLYAEALLLTGDQAMARAEGTEAVRLDPSQKSRFDRMDFARGAVTSTRTEVVIPFDPRRKQIRTKGTVKGIELPFLVDTGATYSTIPRRLADRLGLMANAKPVKVQTAGGTVNTFQVVLPNLRIAGRLELRNVPATIADLGGSLDGAGLLGMDFLQNFDWQKADGKLRLSVPTGKGNKRR